MQRTSNTAGRRRALGIGLVLAVATALLYAPVRHYGFVNYDDDAYVTDSPHIVAGLTAGGIVWAFTNTHSATWHPLTSVSHMLDCQLFGLRPGAHHAVNVLLHVLNTLLLFAVLRRMTGAVWRSAWVAGAFALHPLHVESVAWIAERKDVLSTCFWLLTLGAYARYVERRSPGRYGLVLLGFALGLLAKPMLVTLPFVLLLLDYWPLRRWPGRVAAAALLLEKAPLLVLAATVSGVTVLAQQQAGTVAAMADFSIAQRIPYVVVAYATYLAKLLWPVHLAVFYPFEVPLPAWKLGAAALALLGVSAGCLRLARQRPAVVVGWLWYLGTLVPVIGIVQVGEQAMADRYTYVPYIGVFVMLAWGLSGTRAGRRSIRAALAVAGVLALVAWSGVARGQVRVWRDSAGLFAHALAATRDNYVAHTGLGVALRTQGRTREALDHFAEAVRIKPADPRVQLNLARALDALGRGDEAAVYYQETLRLDPYYAEAQYNFALRLAELGRLDDAIAYYRAALALKPGYARAYNNLGWALAEQGQLAAAAAAYREAVRLEPALAAAHNNLAVALERLGQTGAALAAYAEVVRLAPEDPRAHYNLAAALAAEGRVTEAREHWRAALRLDPGFQAARDALDESQQTTVDR